MPEFPIVSANALASLQKRAGMPGESDELQGGIESLAVAVTRGLVTLPLMLQLPVRPLQTR